MPRARLRQRLGASRGSTPTSCCDSFETFPGLILSFIGIQPEHVTEHVL